MTLPVKSTYPERYDTKYELKTVKDSLYSRTTSVIIPYDQNDPETYDWVNGEGVIFLEDVSSWPDSGYVTIYLDGHWDYAINRAVRFHYNSKTDNTTLSGVTLMDGQNLQYLPESSIAIQNVVAENHNYSKDSIINLESYLGSRFTIDTSTLEWFANFYTNNVRVPKAWIEIKPILSNANNFNSNYQSSIICISGDYLTIVDRTSRIQPGFTQNLDQQVEWEFEIGSEGPTSGSGIEARIKISLDTDNEEYVFNITKFRNGQLSEYEERKKTWDKRIHHRFVNQGFHYIRLFVKNEFGEDELMLHNIVNVIEKAPKSLSLNVSGPFTDSSGNSLVRCLSERDQITLKSFLENEDQLRISKYLWDIPNKLSDEIPSAPSLRLTFEVGGIYDIGLKVISVDGSWIGSFLDNAIDVVEKNSVWIGYVSKASGKFTLHEYSPGTDSWKNNGVNFNLSYSYDFIQNDESYYDLSFRNSKGMHAIPLTDTAFLLWAPDERSVNSAQYNSMTNSFINKNTNIRMHNWFTLHMPVFNSSRIYILGGTTDLQNFAALNQQITYYDIDSDSYTTTTQEMILPSDGIGISLSKSFENAQDIIINPSYVPGEPTRKLIKWKTANYAGMGYVLRNSENDILEDMFKFDPSLNLFHTINSNAPFAKTELGMNGLSDGIYIVSNIGDIFRYTTDTNTWTTTTVGATKEYDTIFRQGGGESANDNATLVSGSEARTINSSNTNLYFSYNYSKNAFGKFDSTNLTYSRLGARPNFDGDFSVVTQWDAIVL